MTAKVSDVTSRIEAITARLKSGVNRTEPDQEAVIAVHGHDIVERDATAMTAMLDLALKRAGGASKSFVLDYGLPPPRDPMPEHATYWRADRDYLQRTWGPAGNGARVAPHPSSESVAEPPSAMMCSARLA